GTLPRREIGRKDFCIASWGAIIAVACTRPYVVGGLSPSLRRLPESEIPWRISLSTKAGMPMRPFSLVLSATALVLLASGAACSNDSGVTGPTALEGQYKGTMAGEYGPTFSASLDLTVAATTTCTIKPERAAPISVTV